jgi:hypothetical protein
MNTEQIEREFDQIARRLRRDDAELVRRIARLRRRAAARVALVVTLLVAALVLLAAGLALLSPIAWLGGLAAFVAAPCVDALLRIS